MNKKIYKTVKIFFCVFIALMSLSTLFSFGARAADHFDKADVSIDDELDMSGADELYEGLDDDIKSILNDLGIDEISPDSLVHLDFSKIINLILNALKDRLFTPVKIFALTVGVMLLNSAFAAFKNSMSREDSAGKIFSLVSVLAAFAVISAPITDAVGKCSEVISKSGNFMLGYIPVFMSSLVMSGKTASAGIYSSFLLTAAQVISQTVNAFLLPMITVYMALSVAGAVCDTINLNGMAQTAKKTILWVIGIMMTVFVGTMSLQGIVAGSADTLGMRTAKFIIGSTVPVVGGAMSEAFNSLHACLGLLKSTLGVFGAVITIVIYLPAVINTALISLSLSFACFIGDIFGDKTTVGLTRAAASAMSVLLSILLISMALNIVSVTAILVITGG